MDATDALTTAFAVTQVVARARTVEQAAELALDAIATVLPTDRTAVLLFDEDGVMRFRVHRGLSDAYRAAVEGHSPWSADTTDAEPIVIADVEADETLGPALRAVLLREGIRAVVFVPLLTEERLLGKFMVYFDEPRPLSPNEVTLTRLVAAQVGFALTRLRAERLVTEAREELQRILESVPDGLIVHDAAGNVRFVNEAMIRMSTVPGAALKERRSEDVAA
ncbi:MAG: GAF domain-containing protein, partial [Myxococcota bacterium]